MYHFLPLFGIRLPVLLRVTSPSRFQWSNEKKFLEGIYLPKRYFTSRTTRLMHEEEIKYLIFFKYLF